MDLSVATLDSVGGLEVAEWCWADVVAREWIPEPPLVQDTRETPSPRPGSLHTPSQQAKVRSILSTSPPEEQPGQVDSSVSGFISHETTAHYAIVESYPLIENDVGVEQGWVEGFSRLESARPPADVPLRRWVQVIDDFGRLVDSGFARKAAMLGWTALDLFGCDREKPFARIDRQGLCWLIAGNRLIELSESGAIIETWTGARQTWRRKPREPGRVPAWELMP